MQLNLFRPLLLLAIAAISLSAQSPTPTQSTTPKITHVLATLTVKDGINRAELTKVLPTEVRDTVALYLDGKIQQWYSRGDGKGVVFILDCKTVEEAKAVLENLPLVKGNFASFDYMLLGPLAPLRVLMAPPTP